MSDKTFDPQELARVARLSRLTLDNTTSERVCAEMGGILGLIQTLQATDTQGVEPLAHPLSAMGELALRRRGDIASSSEDRDANLANAPQTEDGLFLVPRVVE